MKVNLSLKNKEANLEADIEGLVEKQLDYRAKKPAKKTRYQIKQEEKRKNEELRHKQQMQRIFIGISGVAAMILLLVFLYLISA